MPTTLAFVLSVAWYFLRTLCLLIDGLLKVVCYIVFAVVTWCLSECAWVLVLFVLSLIAHTVRSYYPPSTAAETTGITTAPSHVSPNVTRDIDLPVVSRITTSSITTDSTAATPSRIENTYADSCFITTTKVESDSVRPEIARSTIIDTVIGTAKGSGTTEHCSSAMSKSLLVSASSSPAVTTSKTIAATSSSPSASASASAASDRSSSITTVAGPINTSLSPSSAQSVTNSNPAKLETAPAVEPIEPHAFSNPKLTTNQTSVKTSSSQQSTTVEAKPVYSALADADITTVQTVPSVQHQPDESNSSFSSADTSVQHAATPANKKSNCAFVWSIAWYFLRKSCSLIWRLLKVVCYVAFAVVTWCLSECTWVLLLVLFLLSWIILKIYCHMVRSHYPPSPGAETTGITTASSHVSPNVTRDIDLPVVSRITTSKITTDSTAATPSRVANTYADSCFITTTKVESDSVRPEIARSTIIDTVIGTAEGSRTIEHGCSAVSKSLLVSASSSPAVTTSKTIAATSSSPSESASAPSVRSSSITTTAGPINTSLSPSSAQSVINSNPAKLETAPAVEPIESHAFSNRKLTTNRTSVKTSSNQQSTTADAKPVAVTSSSQSASASAATVRSSSIAAVHVVSSMTTSSITTVSTAATPSRVANTYGGSCFVTTTTVESVRPEDSRSTIIGTVTGAAKGSDTTEHCSFAVSKPLLVSASSSPAVTTSKTIATTSLSPSTSASAPSVRSSSITVAVGPTNTSVSLSNTQSVTICNETKNVTAAEVKPVESYVISNRKLSANQTSVKINSSQQSTTVDAKPVAATSFSLPSASAASVRSSSITAVVSRATTSSITTDSTAATPSRIANTYGDSCFVTRTKVESESVRPEVCRSTIIGTMTGTAEGSRTTEHGSSAVSKSLLVSAFSSPAVTTSKTIAATSSSQSASASAPSVRSSSITVAAGPTNTSVSLSNTQSVTNCNETKTVTAAEVKPVESYDISNRKLSAVQTSVAISSSYQSTTVEAKPVNYISDATAGITAVQTVPTNVQHQSAEPSSNFRSADTSVQQAAASASKKSKGARQTLAVQNASVQLDCAYSATVRPSIHYKIVNKNDSVIHYPFESCTESDKKDSITSAFQLSHHGADDSQSACAAAEADTMYHAPPPATTTTTTTNIKPANVHSQFPLSKDYEFRLVCDMCFKPKAEEMMSERTHSCRQDILAVKKIESSQWRWIRQRNISIRFLGDYGLCRKYQYGRPKSCYTKCSYAHCDAERLLWNLEKNSTFRMTEFISGHQITAPIGSVASLLENYPVSVFFSILTKSFLYW